MINLLIKNHMYDGAIFKWERSTFSCKSKLRERLRYKQHMI